MESASSGNAPKNASFATPKRVKKVLRQQEANRSEFVGDAVLCTIDEGEWRRLLQYGEARARAKGIGPEDVADLVEEFRVRRKERASRSERWEGHDGKSWEG